jgi:hypothetical protein
MIEEKIYLEILWDLHIADPEQLSQYSNWAVG